MCATYMCICPGQTCLVWRSGLVSGCLPQTFFWERVSRWTWSLPFQLDWLAKEPPGSACLPSLLTSAGLIGTCCPTQCFYIGSKDINSGSRASGMSTLPTEPPPQPFCTIKASRLPTYPTQHMWAHTGDFKPSFVSKNKSVSDLNSGWKYLILGLTRQREAAPGGLWQKDCCGFRAFLDSETLSQETKDK